MKKFKSGFVSIIGRPNVGKSTLLNKILGQKIVIATNKAQTTRRRIKGIYTDDNSQIVFIDTPGVHKPLDKMGEFLVEEAKFAISDTDLIVFLVDVSTPAGRGDKWIAKNLLETDIPIFIVFNKADLIKNEIKREENIISYKTLFNKNFPTFKISAKTGRNIDTLIDNIKRKLPNGDLIYPEDLVSDESIRNIAQEIIREKILENTMDEIPHASAVIIDKFEETDKIDRISATIIVDQDSQKGIVIGKKGAMLKKIGTEARLEIEKITEKKAFLELFVKVEKNWRKNKKLVEKWGKNL
ncbi:GTPase Era [bacterium]|nr:GTPase Era [bacterium]